MVTKEINVNRYAAAGMTSDAESGKRVLVLSRTAVAAREAMREVEATIGECDVTIRRAAGAQRVEWLSGGSIDFRSAAADIRGVEADVVFIDEGADQAVSPVEISHALAGRGGELIRC